MSGRRDDPLARLEDEPQVEGGVHHPYTAFNQGWDAREAGHARDLNPYEPGTREAHWWDLGWQEAGDDGGGEPEIPAPPSVTSAHRRRRAPRGTP